MTDGAEFEGLANTLRNILDFAEPTTEQAIRDEIKKGILRGYSEAQVKHVLGELQVRNEIRWVAFSGWCLGGRP
jgi:hypothetical protein